MADHSRADFEATHAQTVLDHIRPTVVIRRRAAETAPSQDQPEEQCRVTAAVSVARRRFSLASDWEQLEPEQLEPEQPEPEPLEPEQLEPEQLEPEQQDDEPARPREPARTAPSAKPAAPAKRISVGGTIPVSKLAAALKSSSGEVAAELVSRGFFEVTTKSIVSRQIAHVAARAFGFEVEETAEAKVTPLGVRRTSSPRRKPSAKAMNSGRKAKKVKAKARARPKAKAKVRAKPKAKARSRRSGPRRAAV